MGVGVFHSTFQDRGGTFLISGPLGTDEDYESYRKECIADGDEPMDRDDWAQQEYDDENEFLLDSVMTAGVGLDFQASPRKGFRSENAPFDREFSQIVEDDFVSISWRSWQHDFVIGVGPTNRAAEILDMDDSDASEDIKNALAAFKTDYEALVDASLEAMRIDAMQNGFECRYRTSGYTTSAYSPVENVKERYTELGATIASLREKLSTNLEKALGEDSAPRM